MAANRAQGALPQEGALPPMPILVVGAALGRDGIARYVPAGVQGALPQQGALHNVCRCLDRAYVQKHDVSLGLVTARVLQ